MSNARLILNAILTAFACATITAAANAQSPPIPPAPIPPAPIGNPSAPTPQLVMPPAPRAAATGPGAACSVPCSIAASGRKVRLRVLPGGQDVDLLLDEWRHDFQARVVDLEDRVIFLAQA